MPSAPGCRRRSGSGWPGRSAHYGVRDGSLERTPELEEAVFRIFLAQQRGAADAAVVAALLREWLREGPPGESLREPAGLALEQLVAATQVRFPAVSDLARGVVFAWFAQPLLRRSRAEVYAGVRRHLRHLDRHPDAPDRGERIAAMVASSQPLVRLLALRLGRDDVDHAPLLEVLTRRYYGNKALADVHTRQVAGCPFVVAEHPQADVRVVTTAVPFTALADALLGVGELATGRDVAADIYLAWDNQPEDPDAMAAELRGMLATADLPGQVRRVTTTVAGRGGAMMHHHFTFRPSPAGFAEERLIRGLHPLIAQRMQLERLRNFDLTRLPSSDEEVYLFRCVAPENPSDERLVALAQLRDLTPLREHDGRLVALPAAEDILATCLDSIRRAQASAAVNQTVQHQPDPHLRVAAERPHRRGSQHDRAARAADHRGRRPGGSALPGEAAQPPHRRGGRRRRAHQLRRRRGHAAVGR